MGRKRMHLLPIGVKYYMAAGFFRKRYRKGTKYSVSRVAMTYKSPFYQLLRNSLYNFSTHLLLRGGVHYLTLSGLVKPVKWRFSRLCCFHQASSNCIVFVANGVWEMPINYDVSIYVDDNAMDCGVFIDTAARLI